MNSGSGEGPGGVWPHGAGGEGVTGGLLGAPEKSRRWAESDEHSSVRPGVVLGASEVAQSVLCVSGLNGRMCVRGLGC